MDIDALGVSSVQTQPITKQYKMWQIPQPMGNKRTCNMNLRKIIQFVAICIFVALFGVFIYPGVYKFDKFDQKNPVKINRITGHTQVLIGDSWLTVSDSDETKQDEVEILKAELAKNRDELKKEIINEIREDVINEVKNDLDAVKSEVTAYQKFETDPSNYFSIGSTMEEVKNIMGTPSSTRKMPYFNEETWTYNMSSITFKNGKVSEYRNSGNNLRVK